MGSCNGHAEIIDIEEAKRGVFEAALKSVEVAKNQQADLLQKFLEIYEYFEPESYESHDHWFLEIPQEASELKPLIKQLKRFSVTMDQILLEETLENRESYTYAKYQISQLIEYLQQLQILTYDNNAEIDDAYPPLPDDLNTDSSHSARQTRDYLVIRNYGRLLELIQMVLRNLQ